MAAPIGEIIAGAVEGTFNTGINIWNTAMQQAKFDYDRALQQHIFQREDTAVQRRLADLQAAGLNPQLAAGSGAGAGAVVSTQAPQMKNLDIGAALDTAMAIEKIKQSKTQTDILNYQLDNEKLNWYYNAANMNFLFGSPDMRNLSVYNKYVPNFRDTNFYKLLQYQVDSQKNSADLIQKQNDWFTTNQILGAVSGIVGDISGLGGGFNNFSRGFNTILNPKFHK